MFWSLIFGSDDYVKSETENKVDELFKKQDLLSRKKNKTKEDMSEWREVLEQIKSII